MVHKSGASISLAELPPGHRGKVTLINGGEMLARRLRTMGIVPGVIVTKISDQILRGPVSIRIGRAVVALGRGMAGKVTVEILP